MTIYYLTLYIQEFVIRDSFQNDNIIYFKTHK